ncbi:MAG: hypothetical protein IPP46_10500 [Bacteroidetes bacterium]|nr:hypothetical protein [Bacteroidota bacterium]
MNATICGTGGTLTATPDGNINVPAGYSVIYVLTSGTGLVIEQVNATPSFTVTSGGSTLFILWFTIQLLTSASLFRVLLQVLM